MSCPTVIKELVERFDSNIKSYKSLSYNETQVRREFIDPFFEALGWDVSNKRSYAEAFKEVIHEYSQKTKDSVEAPDYLFKIGGIRKFFVEAKKPSVNLKDDPNPAFQVRRYAWSAKLPLSILTDFEEFIVYDCRIKPNINDKPSTGRIYYFTYKDYIEKWDEIESVFSRDSIVKGSFDRFVESKKNKKGTAEVDDEILSEIENWRDALAKNIALRNTQLTNRELNFAVQKTIDRIIFLRICEDRGIEDYGQLMTLQNGSNVYPRLLQIFTRADEKYNSGLFYFDDEKGRADYPDTLTNKILIDDKVIKEIIKNLYYPFSPYEFSVLPADILGHVYEQFLGKVIRLTAGHRAIVEEKPEVKKAGGVYYTPTYIVDYIVKNTLGKKLDDITEKYNGKLTAINSAKIISEVSRLKALDPACGSGSFLLGAYQYLLDWHLNFYNSFYEKESATFKKESPVYKAGNDELKLTTSERKRILLNNIYGVDIDSQAVEVTKLSLMLKVLEGETGESLTAQMSMFRQRALPDLGNNIKCGNSLIGPDFYNQTSLSFISRETGGEVGFDDEERMRINVFDWNAEFKEIMNGGGFDVVIGNPPYVQSRSDQINKNEKTYYTTKYSTVEYQINTYALFLEKGFMLLNPKGLIGFIVPNYWLSTKYDKLLREYLFIKHSIIELINVYNVFKLATVDTLILIGGINTGEKLIRINSISCTLNSITERLEAVKQSKWDVSKLITIKAGEEVSINFKNDFELEANSTLGYFFDFKFGMKPYERGKGNPPQTEKMVENKIYDSKTKIDESFLPLLKARSIKRYFYFWDNYWIKYGDNLAAARNFEIFKHDRILIQRIISKDKIDGCFLNEVFICNTDVITLKIKEAKYSSEYFFFLGIILSKLTASYIKNKNVNLDRNAFPKINTATLASFPVPYFDSSNQKFWTTKNSIKSMTKKISQLYIEFNTSNTPQEKQTLQRQIDATDKQIDKLVYKLYGLTEEEIKIVEGE